MGDFIPNNSRLEGGFFRSQFLYIILFTTEFHRGSQKMKTIAISKFKAKASKIIEQVATMNERIIITKHGKPLVQVIPFVDSEYTNEPGKLANTLLVENDIVTPFGEDIWDACK